jgi:hypothetical protein
MRCFITILMLSISGHSLVAEDPAETWMVGYLYLQEALAIEKRGDKGGAISLLVRSLDCYRILAREHAEFEPDRRNKRIVLIADKLESLGGDPFASLLPTPATPARRSMLPPDHLAKVLVPALPHHWSLRMNSFGTHVVVPLIETDETRRYHAMIRRLESEFYPGYRLIPLAAR